MPSNWLAILADPGGQRNRRAAGHIVQADLGNQADQAILLFAERVEVLNRGRGRRHHRGGKQIDVMEECGQLHSTNPIERLNAEIKRRTNVVGILPNEAFVTRLIGALLLEQNDEWAVQRGRYMSLEKLAAPSDDPEVRLTPPAA